MADNTLINLGSGGDTIATDDLTTLNGGAVSGVKVQRMKVGFGSDGAFRDVDSSNGLPIVGTQAAVTTANWTSATSVNTASTISVTGYNTVTVAMSNTGTMTAGVLTFEVSPDNTNWFPIALARIDSYTVETTYTLNTVAARAWSTSVDGFTNFRVRLSTVITGTGTATVIITPQAMPIEPIVSVGQLTPGQLVARVGGTATGGLTTFTQISAATTNAASVKASAGTVYSIQASNIGAAVAFLKLYNKASAPTVGTDVAVKTLILPPNGGIVVNFTDVGAAFSTGIATAVTGVGTTADTTAVALAQVIINIDYI